MPIMNRAVSFVEPTTYVRIMDAGNRYVDSAILCRDADNPEMEPYPYAFPLQEGQHYLEGIPAPPVEQCLPRWDGEGWVDDATDVQKAAHLAELAPEPPAAPKPGTEERLCRLETFCRKMGGFDDGDT